MIKTFSELRSWSLVDNLFGDEKKLKRKEKIHVIYFHVPILQYYYRLNTHEREREREREREGEVKQSTGTYSESLCRWLP